MLGNSVLTAVPQPGVRNTNMNSIGPGPVRNTYGPGGPVRPAPRTGPSDLTGTKTGTK
jgi:hypothetical protein